MCVLSDCVVRIETGLWVIRLHYVAYVPKCCYVFDYCGVDHATTGHGRRAWPAVGTGRWALAVHSSQFTYRLRHSLTDHDRTGVQLPGQLPDQFPKV